MFDPIRRAPLRALASSLAIALALAAIGVFAVTDVARSSLRDTAGRDQLHHLAVDTTPIEDPS
ncbi:MAG: hypothetical protein KDB21_01115, partial [Acidimicrobiales bacterium]|nr:hypothetical protein [Acidimicrobiales bacterium]